MTQQQQGKQRLQQRAIVYLLSERTLKDAARKCGVSVRTIQRWLRDESFRAEYQAAKTELLRFATAKLRMNATEAADTLAAIFSDAGASPSARVAAAVSNLRLALEAEAQETLESRISQLEAQGDEI